MTDDKDSVWIPRDQQDHKILQLCFGRLKRKKNLKIHDALNETRVHANK